MFRYSLLLAAGALVLSACSSGNGDIASAAKKSKKPKQLTTVSVGTVNTALMADMFVAINTGIFKKLGLTVQYQAAAPSAAVAGIDSGSLNLGNDGAGMLTGVIDTHASTLFMTNGPSLFYLAVPKSIKSFKTLKGKTVSASTPGGAIDTTTRTEIANAGVTVGTAPTDAHITYLKTNSSSLAALKDGSVSGAGVSPPTSIQAIQQGDHLLSMVTLSPDALWAVNKSWAASHKKAVVAFVKGMAEGTTITHNATKNKKDMNKCESALARFLTLTTKAQEKGSCQEYAPYQATDPIASCQITTLEKTLKPPQSIPVKTLTDYSYLNAIGKKNWVKGKTAFKCK